MPGSSPPPEGHTSCGVASCARGAGQWLRVLLLLGAAAVILTGLQRDDRAGKAGAGMPVRRGEISYFYERECEKCAQAEPLVRAYALRHPELPLRAYDMHAQHSRGLRRGYDSAYRVPRWKQLGVPAVFVEDRAYLGLAEIERLIAGAPPRASTQSARGRLQSAADRYAPIMLRGLLAMALIAAALLCRRQSNSLPGRFRLAVRLFLALVLAVAAGWKASHVMEVAELLRDTWRLGPSLFAGAWLGAWAVVGAEAAVAALLVVGRPRRVVPWAALVMYATFFGYSMAALTLSVSGDCGCFPWPESLGWGTAARNGGFVLLAWLLFGAAPRNHAGLTSEGESASIQTAVEGSDPG